MAATLEAANNGRTGSHGLTAGARGSGERPRTNRVFKDIHGAESHHPNTVIIDRDLTKIAPETIRDAKIEYTIVGGRVVFERVNAAH